MLCQLPSRTLLIEASKNHGGLPRCVPQCSMTAENWLALCYGDWKQWWLCDAPPGSATPMERWLHNARYAMHKQLRACARRNACTMLNACTMQNARAITMGQHISNGASVGLTIYTSSCRVWLWWEYKRFGLLSSVCPTPFPSLPWNRGEREWHSGVKKT